MTADTRRSPVQGHEPYIELKINSSSIEYGIIHITKATRGFFPGYRRQFILKTDIKPFVMHLTAANNGVQIGSGEGGYLCHPNPARIEAYFLRYVPNTEHRIMGSFKRWYDEHEEIRPGNYVKIYRTNQELYRLES